MKHVNFTDMLDGTQEEYEFLAALEFEHAKKLPGRLLLHLEYLDSSYSGYQVTRLPG